MVDYICNWNCYRHLSKGNEIKIREIRDRTVIKSVKLKTFPHILTYKIVFLLFVRHVEKTKDFQQLFMYVFLPDLELSISNA